MRSAVVLMVLIVWAQGLPMTSGPIEATRQDDLIGESGIGGLRLGMTLDEAKRALPTVRFSRMTDGDGASLVEVTRASGDWLSVWAGEEDPSLPIDWSKRIQIIQTFSAVFHTPEGVRVGSLVTDVERVFGKTKQIIKSEIESREFIEFERQPAHLTFRLDYSGIFAITTRETTRFKPGAKLWSISVSSSP